MRSEEQVLKQIIEFANADNRIRAVMQNGSRINANAPKDIMQDYDVVFFITELKNISYKTDQSWINYFGDLIMLQQNDFEDGSYIFLMQFKDCVRIDLTFNEIKNLNKVLKEDSLSKIVLDKNNFADKFPEPNDSMYFVKKPSQNEWDEVINELWWIQTYVAKEMWRDELPLAKYMYDTIFIDCMRTLLSWHIGLQYDWQINVGKQGKWFKNVLEKELYNEFVSLYAGVDYDEIWQKLYKAGALIRKIGIDLGDKLGLIYPLQDDINVSEFIRKLHILPKNALSFDN